MKIKLSNFQILFLTLYIFFNTYALFYLLIEKETFGDFFEVAENTYFIFLSYTIVILPLVFFGFYIYPYLENKFKMNHRKKHNVNFENKITLFIFFLQILYIVFNLLEGVNSAGNVKTSESIFKYLFYLLPPDLFFLILYGYARDNKYFKYNLLIYLISTIQRGWTGGILFIIIFESYVFFEKYSITKKFLLYTTLCVSFVILLLPYIVALKWAMRSYFGVLGGDLSHEIELVLSLNDQSYLFSLQKSLSELIGRFQIVTNMYLILDNIDILQTAKENGTITSLFSAGLPQNLIYNIFNIEYSLPTSYLIVVIYPHLVLAELLGNTHIGWAGWILIEPHFFVLYLVYSIGLIFVTIYLCSKIGGRYIYFINWVILIMYFLYGWIVAYIAWIIALVTFYLIIYFTRKNINNLYKFIG